MTESKTTNFQRITMLVWLPMIIPLSFIVWSIRGMGAVVDDYWETFLNGY